MKNNRKQEQLRKWISKLHCSRRYTVLMILTILLVIIVLCVSFAWYFKSNNRKLQSEDVSIYKMYDIFLLNAGQTQAFTLNVGNLHPGETKNVVICVSNGAENPTNEDGVTTETTPNLNLSPTVGYTLELAYTENIPLVYKLYEIDSTSESDEDSFRVDGTPGLWKKKSIIKDGVPVSELSGDDSITDVRQSMAFSPKENETKQDLSSVVNVGHYLLFSKDIEGKNFQLSSINPERDCDYYLLEISCEDKEISEFIKETDMIYVIGTAVQVQSQSTKTGTEESTK